MIFYAGLFILSLFCRISKVFLADPILVEAVAGLSAEIPCPVPTPLADDEASLILWYRLDLPNPIYTLDVRKGTIHKARHFPAVEMEGRAHFNVSVHPPVLVLDPVQREDEAEYKCRVDLKKSRTLILHSRLDVIIPPGVPIIMDEHGQHLHDMVGPYDEGTMVLFICEVDGGDPSPEVTWWRGNALLDDSYNVTTQGFVRNEVVVERLQRDDWMAKFSCRATNTNATQTQEASLQLDMNLYPLNTRILPPRLPIVAGVEHELFCETTGSRPPVLTSWWLEGITVTTGYELPPEEDKNVTLGSFKIIPGPENNGERLVCKSVNPVLPNSNLQAEMVLHVQYPPILNLTSVPSDIIREGDDVYVSCLIESNPGVTNIMWEVDGQTDLTPGTLLFNHTLLLPKVRRDQQGKYRCMTSNTIGKGVSKDLNLIVQYAPYCKWPESVLYGLSPSENVSLLCMVEANPDSNITFQWSFNSSSKVADHGTVLEEQSSILQYSLQGEDGYGVFMCWGRNTVGLQTDPCVFKVVPSGPPDPPYNCSVRNHSSQSMLIGCRAGFDGSLQQLFHVEVYDASSENLSHNLTARAPSMVIEGLEPSTSYVIVVYASNTKGVSTSLAITATTLSSAKRRTAREVPSVLSPLFAILFAIVLLSLMACVGIIMSIKWKRKKRRNSLKKEYSITDIKTECEMEKKDVDECQEGSAASIGPDIIPLSKDLEVFHLEGYLEELHRSSECLPSSDSPPTEYIRMKYMHTVL